MKNQNALKYDRKKSCFTVFPLCHVLQSLWDLSSPALRLVIPIALFSEVYRLENVMGLFTNQHIKCSDGTRLGSVRDWVVYAIG